MAHFVLCRGYFIIFCFILFSFFAAAQCPNDNVFWVAGGAPPCGSFGQMQIGGGTYATFNVVQNASYTFSTCLSSYNTMLTGYDLAGNNIFFNDDGGPECLSNRASVNWTATFSGTIRVLVDSFFCTSYSLTSAVLQYRQNNNLTITSSSASMCPGATRTLTATPSGGTFSASCSGCLTGTLFTAPATAGTYTITYTLGQCSRTQNITVTDPPSVTIVNLTGVSTFCAGDSVRLNANASPGSGTISSYQWQRNGANIAGATTVTYTATQAGSYTVIVTNSNGCSSTSAPVVLNVAQKPTVTVSGGTFFCQGGSVTLTATASPGSGTISSYQWKLNGGNVGTNSSTYNANQPGSYTVVVTNSFNCSVESAPPLVITSVQNPTVTATGTHPTCNGAMDGTATALPSGGQPPYSYTWNTTPAQTTQTATGLGPGTYRVTVTDDNGCSAVSNDVTLIDPPALIITPVDSGDPSCAGVNNGFVEVAASGGPTPYQFSLNGSPFQPSGRFNNLTAGTYVALVRDANGCEKTTTFILENQTAILLSVDSLRHVSCRGANDGYFSLVALNGISPYSFSTDGIFFQSSPVFMNKPPGTYNVIAKDAAGCQATVSVIITEPSLLTIAITSFQNNLCAGDSSGAIDITVSGGTDPYSYVWTNGATTEDLADLQAGSYGVTVTDANGCTASVSVTLTQPNPLHITLAKITDVSCNGGTNGQIDITVTGGIPPYVYNWSNGSSLEDNTNLSAGSYGVTVTDANGCTASASYVVNEPPAIALTYNKTDVVCAGDNTGSIDLSVSGGVPPYSYLWSNFASTQDLPAITSGNYTVIVTDANGCSATTTVTIHAVSDILISAIVQEVSCNGSSDGSIDLTISGGVAPYTFLWSNGSGSEDLSGLAGGTYKVTVTDNIGCSDSATFTLTEPAALFLSLANLTHVACAGGHSGAIDITVGGGRLPYRFIWSTGDTTEDVAGLTAGTYAVTVSDAGGCSVSASYAISQPAPLIITAVASPVVCSGDSTGSIDLTVSGGDPPYTFFWSNGATTEDIGNLPNGTYIYTVTDFNGCSKSAAVSVTSASNITVSGNVSPVTCTGNNDGAIDLTVSGGIAPYTFSWSSGQSTEDLNGLSPGIYTVTITDDSNCLSIKTYQITEPQKLQATVSVSHIACNGGSGAVNLVVVGGTPAYQFQWSNGATSEDLSNVSGGSYMVTITDSNGCTETLTAVVNEPAALALQATMQHVTCNSGSDGSIFITVSGGASPYSFLWSNGATTQLMNNIQAGNYGLTVTDNNGCTEDTTFTITQPSSLSTSLTVINPACNSGATGSIDLTASGGTPPYSFLWSNFATTEDITGIPAGSYTVLVTDSRGCVKVDSVRLTQPQPITATASISDNPCFGFAQGSIDLTVSGGSAGYSFAWSTGASSEDVSNLAAGTYNVTVTDLAGCQQTFSYTIRDPDSLELAALIRNVRCFGFNDGRIELNVTGGSGNYTYYWSNNRTTRVIDSLFAGTYAVTVTDGNGCQQSDTFVIVQPTAIITAITSDSVSCFGFKDGALDLTVSGGTPPYSYLWSNFAFTQDLSGLGAGSYSVIVTDQNGCLATQTGIVGEPPKLELTAQAKGLFCGVASGDVQISVSGGTPPYSYLWSNGDTTKNLVSVAPGTYSVTVTDAHQCTVTISQVVNPPPYPIARFIADDECLGRFTEFINQTAIASGFIDSVLWNFGDGMTSSQYNPVHIYQAPGVYTVTLIAISNQECADTVVGQVRVFALPDATIQADPPGAVICAYDSVRLTVATAPGLNYQWSTGQDTVPIYVNQTGEYSITVVDANTCADTGRIQVTAFDPLSIRVTEDTLISKGVSIKLVAEGGVSYVWSPSSYLDDSTAATPVAKPLSTILYTVVITDENGCVAVDSVLVEVAEDFLFNPPNLFTPNGDGHNDNRVIPNIEVYPGCEVGVFNRWGSKIFVTRNYQNDWDGTLNGQPLPDGTYYYVIHCPESDFVLKGAITILR